ncbi:hypothetical protein SDC9_29331 [bioreactor metagenome]|uniref:Uncharacterized protein n=1 Tax=bioreactor metagenome TaxID=1076179 RepID=A0A644UWR5_9ZZZZ
MGIPLSGYGKDAFRLINIELVCLTIDIMAPAKPAPDLNLNAGVTAVNG